MGSPDTRHSSTRVLLVRLVLAAVRMRLTARCRPRVLAGGLVLVAAACVERAAPAGPDPDLAALAVRVRTEGDDAPVAGAIATLQTADRRSGIGASTGPAGEVTFRRIPPGAYLVGVTPPGGRTLAASQPNPVSITLARGQTDTLMFRVAP